VAGVGTWNCRMLSMKKMILFTFIGAAVLVSVWLTGSKVAQSRRDSAYQKALSQFQHDLPLGTPKDEVRNISTRVMSSTLRTSVVEVE
jgi:hypothetical protein